MRHPTFAVLLLFVLVCSTTSDASAQHRSSLPPLEKSKIVNLKIPLNVLTSEGFSLTTGAAIYAGRVSSGSGGYVVEGSADWQTKGFPSFVNFHMEKVGKTKEFTEIELRSDSIWVKLRFPVAEPDVRAAFSAVVIAGPSDSADFIAYLSTAYEMLARRFFTGPLANIPAEKQNTLVRFAHVTANGTTIRNQTYKDNLYLVVDLGRDPHVYNDLRFNQSTLIAHVLNEILLFTLKAFAEPVKDVTILYGLKVEFDIPHKNLTDQYAAAKTYKLELFAPAEQIRKFADADITNQQFIDNCVVIVDGNRIQVSLAAPSSTEADPGLSRSAVPPRDPRSH